MRSPQELLLALGITLPEYSSGIYQTTCPKCSANRLKRHAKCLTVRIQPDKVFGGCNHCGWTFPEPGSGGKESRSDVSYFIYRDRDGAEKFRKAKTRDKKFWIERPDGKGGWVKGAAGIDTSIIYRANEIADVLREHPATLFAICEGEKDCDNLWRLGIAATCNAHGASEPGKRPKWTSKHSEQLRGARLCVIPDNDPAGHDHAAAVIACSTGIAMEVRQLVLKEHWPELPEHGDVSDWLAAGHMFEKLIELLGSAPIKANGKAPEHIAKVDASDIDRLARLSFLEYGQQRGPAAEKLGITKIDYLDKAVDKRRRELLPVDLDRKQVFTFEEVEPWLVPIHTETLLNELVQSLRRFAVLSDHCAVLAALYAPFTYTYKSFHRAPRLEIRAPTVNCGKSQVLDWLNVVVDRPVMSGNVSAASFFRVVEESRPTMLIDEVDTFLREDSIDILNVMNNGYTPNGFVLRCEKIGDQQKVCRFGCFAPLAFAHVGKLRFHMRGLVSRSIKINMERKLPHERAESVGDAIEFLDLKRKCKRWANDNRDALKRSNPEFPSEVTDGRVRNRFHPFLAMADLAGEAWGKRIRAAMIDNIKDEMEDLPYGERLVRDMWEILQREKIVSGRAEKDVAVAASAMYESLRDIDHWKEHGKARKPITDVGITTLLRNTFQLESKKTNQGKVFTFELLRGVYERYLSPQARPSPPRSTLQPCTSEENGGVQKPENPAQAIENAHECKDAGYDPAPTLHFSDHHADDFAAFEAENQDKPEQEQEDDPDAFF